MNAIYDLYDEVAEYGNHSADYVEKMLHKIPAAPVFKREEYLIKAARNKVILDVGASGPMSKALRDVAKEYHGTDIQDNGSMPNYYQIDFDKADSLPDIDGLDIIIAGEVIEHLSNAGHFLDLLRKLETQVILTVPNAFGATGNIYMKRSIESVNREHVAWYSYHTLKVLTERHGFRVLLWAWYNGQPLTAEGLIFHMEPDHGND